ncbi:sensor histidine kinase [Gracilimonas mengyeensis]|uniref:histidine kinase n=1 Tax=Gracilimonas mengyeensis TaxID=1302730 RepID=A0A521F943_9BACT|nr:GAF domain-containing protein [Gracilimonas mengyeensis]SMO92722.1 Two-component sensor histidine kinase, contains HisKA and HATPase domains [Gracilimonas mengyeensis]
MSDSHKHNRQLLLHAIEGVSRTLELKSLLAKSMEAAQELMRANASSLMLIDRMTGELNVSIPVGPVGSKIKGMTIPKGKGISSWVLENREPYFSNNPAKSEKFWKDLSDDFETKNILCVPLLNSHKEAMGVLQVLNRENGEDFTEADINLLQLFAFHVASAIEKVREVDELNRKMEAREEGLKKVHEQLREELQGIASLLQIEAETMSHANAEKALRSAAARVFTISNAHLLLRDDEHLSNIELGAFINELFAYTSTVFEEDAKQIKVRLEAEKITLPVQSSLPLGLLVNEVLILLFRFAFENQKQGFITIKAAQMGDEYITIDISDNGEGIDIEKAEHQTDVAMGKVLYTLARRLNADLSVRENEDRGTTVTVRCPV